MCVAQWPASIVTDKMLGPVVSAVFDVFPDLIAGDVAVAHDPTVIGPADVVDQNDWDPDYPLPFITNQRILSQAGC